MNGAQLVLRIRKCQNQKFYNDPLLMPELDYNLLFMDNLLLKNKHLMPYVAGNQMTVKIDRQYVESVIARVENERIERLLADGRIIPSEGENKIEFAQKVMASDKEFRVDYEYPFACLMHDFTSASQQEGMVSFYFEIKPKSQASEDLPSKIA